MQIYTAHNVKPNLNYFKRDKCQFQIIKDQQGMCITTTIVKITKFTSQ